MRFTKMHGLGNDYVYLNCFEEKIDDPVELAKAVSKRHFAIGADGLILIEPAKKADVKMPIFNADGSEAEMCGNGIRCVAKYAYEHKLAQAGKPLSIPGQPPCQASLKIETARGILNLGLIIDDNDNVQKVCVNMGQPILEAPRIPVTIPAKTIIDQPMQFQSHAFVMPCVSMGNPHAVFFRDNIGPAELRKFGPVIEQHSIFPNRVNVHFVKVNNAAEFTMGTWERGSGITLACGTGACAAAVAAALTNRCDRHVTAHLPGGDLELHWARDDNCVYMTGPAVEVFNGSWTQK